MTRKPLRGMTAHERHALYTDTSGGPDACWPWTAGRTPRGYGSILNDDRRPRGAHRVAYERAYGSIPEGLTVEHRCHTADLTCAGGPTCPHRACQNPAHLEALTNAENVARGRSFTAVNTSKTHCPRNHELTGENIYGPDTAIGRSGKRSCRVCARERAARYKHARQTGTPYVPL